MPNVKTDQDLAFLASHATTTNDNSTSTQTDDTCTCNLVPRLERIEQAVNTIYTLIKALPNTNQLPGAGTYLNEYVASSPDSSLPDMPVSSANFDAGTGLASVPGSFPGTSSVFLPGSNPGSTDVVPVSSANFDAGTGLASVPGSFPGTCFMFRFITRLTYRSRGTNQIRVIT